MIGFLTKRQFVFILTVFVGVVLSCVSDRSFLFADDQLPANSQAEDAVPQTTSPDNAGFVRLAEEGLPNAIQVHSGIISGGQPDPKTGFQSLSKLGVKTIVSVDGIAPDVAAARKAGIRYIHLPLGYRGVSKQRALELAHVILVLDQPIYIHCHHGRHRSPAAAAVACATAGVMTNEQAVRLMKEAGTSSNYQGLFQSARNARQVERSVLKNMSPDLPETADVGPLVEVMVHLDEEMTAIESVLEKESQSPGDFEIQKLSESTTLLNDEFTELLRHQVCDDYEDDFRKSLQESQSASAQLQRLVANWKSSTADSRQSTARGYLKVISEQCRFCHQKYRNNESLELGTPTPEAMEPN